MNSNLILEAREERIQIIKDLIDDYSLILLKVNMFGTNKNNNFSNSILGYTFNYLKNDTFFKNLEYIYYDSYDGAYIIYKINNKIDNNILKEKTINIEESLEFGRLIDLDVFVNSLESINRTIKRKCIICNDLSFNCIRSRKHSYFELENKYKEISFSSFANLISDAISFSMIKELELDPKFGCVTIKSSGSHKDLNYDKMIKCKESLLPYFIDMFKVGFFDKDDYFKKINRIGIDAEEEMYRVINTNAYKGLIFCLGIIVTAVGIYISSFNNISLIDAIHLITKDIDFEIKNDSFGYKAYKELGFGGIRREVSNLFPTIIPTYKEIDLNDDRSIYKYFVYVITNCEDSVLLKRSKSIEFYNYIKDLIKNCDINNKEELDYVNNICVDNNISLGGSCDLLISALFIKYLSDYLNIKEFIK